MEQNRIGGLDFLLLCVQVEQPGFPNCSLVNRSNQAKNQRLDSSYCFMCHIPITGWRASPVVVYLDSDSRGINTTPYPLSRFLRNLLHFVLWANRKSLNILFWEICIKKIWKIQSVSKHFLAYSELPISKMYILWHPNNYLILDALSWVL